MSEESKIKFFGKCDINKQGKIGSSMPAWAMKTHAENLEEELASKKRSLERGEIPLDRVMEVKQEIENEEKRLGDIMSSKPKLTDAQENELLKIHKDMKKEIADWMFTRSDMHLGLADAHEEARRLSKGVIKVDDRVAEICKDNNIQVFEDKKGLSVSRKGAEMLHKHISNYFGESGNSEYLRRDKATARTTAYKR